MKKSKEKQALICIKHGRTYREIECWQYVANGRLNEYEKLCKIPFTVDGHPSVCKTPHGFAITGGMNSDLCIEYNIVTNSWKQLENMWLRRTYHGSICVGGVLYAVGGYFNMPQDATTAVQFVNIEGGSWQSGPKLPFTNPYLRGKLADINGSVYLLDFFFNKELLQLDVEAKVWSKRASLPFPPMDEEDFVEETNMVSVNGKLMIAWTKETSESGRSLYLAQYNPEVDTWYICKHNYAVGLPEDPFPRHLIL